MSAQKIRVAVVGVGEFGRQHVRVWKEMEGARLVGVADADAQRAAQVAAEFGTPVLRDPSMLVGVADAVSLAVPTREHSRLGCRLLEQGLDVLVEKPIAASLGEADELIASAHRFRRILQVGHVERFNPAIEAVQEIVMRPLFFEVHRLGVFTPRSLDVDVIYDVMIHDLDILLALVEAPVVDVRSVGVPVLTDKVDIAHARVEFASGAVANLTASRVSTERVRKMRFFQEHEYVSVDYTRQDVLRIRVNPQRAREAVAGCTDPSFAAAEALAQMQFETLKPATEEPLRRELRAFLQAVATRQTPRVDGQAGRRALELADQVMSGIVEHSRRVRMNVPASRDSR